MTHVNTVMYVDISISLDNNMSLCRESLTDPRKRAVQMTVQLLLGPARMLSITLASTREDGYVILSKFKFGQS